MRIKLYTEEIDVFFFFIKRIPGQKNTHSSTAKCIVYNNQNIISNIYSFLNCYYFFYSQTFSVLSHCSRVKLKKRARIREKSILFYCCWKKAFALFDGKHNTTYSISLYKVITKIIVQDLFAKWILPIFEKENKKESKFYFQRKQRIKTFIRSSI